MHHEVGLYQADFPTALATATVPITCLLLMLTTFIVAAAASGGAAFAGDAVLHFAAAAAAAAALATATWWGEAVRGRGGAHAEEDGVGRAGVVEDGENGPGGSGQSM